MYDNKLAHRGRAVAISRRAAIARILGAAAIAGTTAGYSQVNSAVYSQGGGGGGRDSEVAADPAPELTAEQRAAGVTVLKRHVSVDLHCHPGRFFLTGLGFETAATRGFGQPFEERAIADLRAGNVSGGLFAAVSDVRLLEVTPTGIRSNAEFQAGEALGDYRAQRAEFGHFAARKGLTPGLRPADIERAHRSHLTAALFAVEGGDFVEDRLDRIQEAFENGARAVTIVHYHVNQIGDIQTQPPVHGGLTPLGKSVIREMNRVGMIVDLAHATFEVARDTIGISDKPVLVSHSNIATPQANHPRLITPEHARLVASAGGIIGAWPSGFGQTTFADYIDSIMRLVDTVGVDHVGIGTDMDANYKPVLRTDREWSLIPAALLAKGLHENEVAGIMGGNFQRVFGANLH